MELENTPTSRRSHNVENGARQRQGQGRDRSEISTHPIGTARSYYDNCSFRRDSFKDFRKNMHAEGQRQDTKSSTEGVGRWTSRNGISQHGCATTGISAADADDDWRSTAAKNFQSQPKGHRQSNHQEQKHHGVECKKEDDASVREVRGPSTDEGRLASDKNETVASTAEPQEVDTTEAPETSVDSNDAVLCEADPSVLAGINFESAKGRAPCSKGSGRGRNIKGRVAWGENLTLDVRISKTLTQILRHKALDLGIDIRRDGFCKLSEVLKSHWLEELNCTVQDVQKVVGESDKQRFELRPDGDDMLIRAVQGHSMKVVEDECLLEPLRLDDGNLPNKCIHGTYHRFIDSIFKNGLRAGGGLGAGFRNHVHFVPYEPGDERVISGMRENCEVAIWINLADALKDNVPFYISANKVILSPGIDGVISAKYFQKAKDLSTGHILYPSPGP